MEEVFTILETAQYLKVSDKTIRRLIDKKDLVASKVGTSWRIEKKNIDLYLNKNRNVEIEG